jgi:glycosyltransferase involved in cell wall biosynthesis
MISIVITCFNEDRKYLPNAIGSCLTQDVPVEIILVDGGSNWSPDITIINQIYNSVDIFIRTHDNGGQAGALNLGIQNAKYPYIIVLDADNWLYPNVLGDMLSKMGNITSVVFGNLTNTIAGEIIKPAGKDGLSRELFLQCNPIFTTSLFRKTVWEVVGGFKPIIYTDYRFYLDLFLKGICFNYIDKIIYNHVIRKDSTSFKVIDRVEELNKQAIEPLL